ncbi:MAG: hypothetical protein PHP00_13300 [Thiotrichaceae bacterium]|nr:hypothetical protein [Thiotrichaceae bacterium]
MKLLMLTFVSLFLITGCFPSPEMAHPEYKMLNAISDREQKHLVFSKFPLEKQLEIHLAATSQTHPPDLSFVIGLTMHREKMFPVLISQIELDKKELLSPNISVDRKFEIDYRKNGMLYIFDSIINSFKCDIKITREQIKFFLEEELSLNYRTNHDDLIRDIFDLLNCPQFSKQA